MVDIVLGFDFGIKRIGIAMGNTLTGQAQPLSVIKAVDNATRFKVIGWIGVAVMLVAVVAMFATM